MNETASFGATYPRYSFSGLVRLALAAAAVLLRLRVPRAHGTGTARPAALR